MRLVIEKITIFLLLFIFGCTIAKSEVRTMRGFSKSGILEIANNKAKELGYNVIEMRVSFDRENTAWANYNKNNVVFKNNPDIEKELQGKDYWVVYYGPKGLQLGGDLWVFIDKNNGEIITTIKGE